MIKQADEIQNNFRADRELGFGALQLKDAFVRHYSYMQVRSQPKMLLLVVGEADDPPPHSQANWLM